MKFVYRLGYYLGGLTIGIFFLLFFLGGKKAQCSYFPEARVMKDIGKKPIRLSVNLREQMKAGNLDTMAMKKILRYGDVDFSKSETDTMPCKFYHISGKEELEDTFVWVKNCERYVRIMKMEKQ